MKNRVFFVLAALFVLFLPSLASADDDLAKHKSCTYCGMDREKWNFSRVFIEYDDGSTDGTCSLHCAAVSLALNLDKAPAAIWVADYDTRQLIRAEDAVWVVGGSKPGVMSKRAKWAFADQAASRAFIGANGGTEAVFEQAVKVAYEDMYEDTLMIRVRRAAKRKAAEPAQTEAVPAAQH